MAKQNMLLEEFDVIIDRMRLAFETAQNLGQSIEAAKVLYQINEILPENLQLALDGGDDSTLAEQVVLTYEGLIKTAIAEYREELMVI
ncbi:MAG: hypothetical protein OEL77_05190 [Nitrosopumilus sp.]|nr:hypothetical protein [Nitrosopumilus sp.]MDH3385389.1 hypothetical protein [Nitrosopumilus sp.]